MLNPIAGKRGGAIAKELSAIIKNPGCYFPHRREVEDAIGWLTGEEMAIDKANLIDRLDWARSPEAVSVSPDGLPGLLLEAIELLESPSKIPLKKNIFVKIDVNSWSVDEPFITDHKPATKEEMSLKKIVYRLISDGEVDDFYCPTIRPMKAVSALGTIIIELTKMIILLLPVTAFSSLRKVVNHSPMALIIPGGKG
ncbi:hypothetical protein IKG06_03280 [Candidatus Saccharibacteria bacterium]|nr:hypothetical protein [Candidatus Saccharibacteria bacterium]